MSDKRLDPPLHEKTDVGAGVIWLIVTIVPASALLLALVVLKLFPHALEDKTLPSSLPPYPAPRLQSNPRVEMNCFYDAEMQWLNGGGWIDKARDLAHIPITDAMQKVADENIPGWPSNTPSGSPEQAKTPTSPSSEKPHEAHPPPSPSTGVEFSRLRRQQWIKARLSTSNDWAREFPSSTCFATTPAPSFVSSISLKGGR